MHIAAIPYRNGKLEACERDDVWTVRLADLETRASYLDLALAELLGDAPEAHRVAARLLSELAEVVERQEAVAHARVALAPRAQRGGRSPGEMAKPVVLVARAAVFVIVLSTAFMMTTWLTTLR